MFALVTVWCVGGAIVTLTVAWLNARVNGAYWFNPQQSKRWTSGDELPPPLLIFLAWPLVIPVSLVALIGAGFFRMTEKLGNKLIELAERQAKQVRGNG